MTKAPPGRPASRAGGPRGETQVRAALVAAAADLFADRGPGAVTVREIADVAQVNHGLVHHYFGSKDALVTAVLDHLAAEALAEITDARDLAVLSRAGSATETHGRIVAHVLLEGRELGDLKATFPVVQALVARYRRDQDVPAADAQARVAQAAAMVLGWQLFEPYLLAATGLEVPAGGREGLLQDALARLLRP